MTAWQIVLQQLNTKHISGNICEYCGARFVVNNKQLTKRFCTENCQREARTERRKAN